MLRSRITTLFRKLDSEDCKKSILLLNQNVSEPDGFSIQFQACNTAIMRKAMVEWASEDERIVTQRCEFCVYDPDTARKVVRQVCPD